MDTLKNYTLHTTNTYKEINNIIENELQEEFNLFMSELIKEDFYNLSNSNKDNYKENSINRFYESDFYKKNFYKKNYEHSNYLYETHNNITNKDHKFYILGKKIIDKIDKIFDLYIQENYNSKKVNNILN